MRKPKRIAYFLAKYPIHQQVADGALMFANNGYHVDVFLYQSPNIIYDFKRHPNINVIDCTDNDVEKLIPGLFSSQYMFVEKSEILDFEKKIIVFGTGELAQVFLKKMSLNVTYYLDNNEEKWGGSVDGRPIYSPSILKNEDIDNSIIIIASSYYKEIAKQLSVYGLVANKDFYSAQNILDQFVFSNFVKPKSFNYLMKNQYDVFIGVEKIGVIWAGMLAERLKVPYLYHSLELYTSDYPNWNEYYLLHQFEKKYHKNAIATIIQDQAREKVLLQDNEISSNHQVLHVPVSITSENIEMENFNYFVEKFSIDHRKTIVLLWAMITPARFCEEIIIEAQNLSSDFQVVIQGLVFDQDYLRYLNDLDIKNKIIFSTEPVKYDKIKEVIDSADIGLAFYRGIPINDQLTVLSSEKIARYLEAGKPIITFNYENYRSLMDENLFGVYIDNFSELQNALLQIKSNYEYYSEKSHQAFKKYYDYDQQYKKVIEFIDLL